MMMKSLVVLVVLAVCLQLASARPSRRQRPGGQRLGFPNHKHMKFLGRGACEIVNGTEPTTNKTCGCGDDAGAVKCELGPLSLTDKGGNTLQVTFCAVENNWTSPRPWRGVLKTACQIVRGEEVLKNTTCPDGAPCVTDQGNFISTQINNTDVKAFFCGAQLIDTEREPRSRKNDEDSSSSEESEESSDESSDGEEEEEGAEDEEDVLTEDYDEDDDEDDDCVPLNKCQKLRKSKRGQRNDGTRRQGRRNGRRDRQSDQDNQTPSQRRQNGRTGRQGEPRGEMPSQGGRNGDGQDQTQRPVRNRENGDENRRAPERRRQQDRRRGGRAQGRQ